ncbi:hypothetical protein BB561_001321 [Smittium simulii]|uniref:Uncharacterized protein n=1 Tax=Smittium simulii TaxID=133385 RepID=A0A2T9YV31_9FUNG|nr:hypothetical protein BB561_001321 [Smittium simulii]
METIKKILYSTKKSDQPNNYIFNLNYSNIFMLANNPPNIITKNDVINGLKKFKGQLPNTEVIHALALWEIHRAKTEYNLSNINLSGYQMFNRWEINLKNQITMDWSTSKTSAEQWTKTKTKWFYIEPDGNNKENIVFNEKI